MIADATPRNSKDYVYQAMTYGMRTGRANLPRDDVPVAFKTSEPPLTQPGAPERHSRLAADLAAARYPGGLSQAPHGARCLSWLAGGESRCQLR